MTLDLYVSMAERARTMNTLRLRDPKIIELVQQERRDRELQTGVEMDMALRVRPLVID